MTALDIATVTAHVKFGGELSRVGPGQQCSPGRAMIKRKPSIINKGGSVSDQRDEIKCMSHMMGYTQTFRAEKEPYMQI